MDTWEENRLSLEVKRATNEYLGNKEHRREFEEWYERTYGEKYVWKKGSEINAFEQ